MKRRFHVDLTETTGVVVITPSIFAEDDEMSKEINIYLFWIVWGIEFSFYYGAKRE